MAFGRNCEYASVADCIQDQTGKVSNPAEFCENLRRETESQCEQRNAQNPQATPKSAGAKSQPMGNSQQQTGQAGLPSQTAAPGAQSGQTGQSGEQTDDTDPNRRQQEQYKRDNETQPNTRKQY